MQEQPPQRVRVVLAGGTPAPRPHGAAAREVEEQTPVGEVLVCALFGVQPLLFAVAPGVARTEVAGLPLPWLLLGVLAYPAVFAVAWVYVRAAERNEKHFAELVSRE